MKAGADSLDVQREKDARLAYGEAKRAYYDALLAE